MGAIWNYFVDTTGAVWQDWEGSTSYLIGTPSAVLPHHQPKIPNLAPAISLRDALIDPLARTDFLPIYANYADSRFEKFGGAESFATAVRVVAREQNGQGHRLRPVPSRCTRCSPADTARRTRTSAAKCRMR